MSRLLGFTTMVSAIVVIVTGLTGCGGQNFEPLEIRTISNRADLISGGDAMVEIILPSGGATKDFSVAVDGRDVTSAFSEVASGRLRGVIAGLKVGDNVITATSQNARSATLTVTNAPRHGPVLSGVQVIPYYCATPVQQAVNGNDPARNASGLSGTPDANCNITSEFKLYYRTTAAGCSLALPDPTAAMSALATSVPSNPVPSASLCFKPYTVGSTPADIATTTNDAGVTVPYIVRVERGTLNRGIYDIAVLYDPSKTWSPLSPQSGWNGKVIFNFGASTGQPRRQARPATAWSGSDLQLARGVMVVANSMADSARNSNRVLMSETVMMMKEHINDTYGQIRYTIGSGCSGGSINSNMAASIMPGLLDGVTTTCTYPDSETTSLEVGDCVLLVEAYQKPQWVALMAGQNQTQIDARKAAINGHTDPSACHAWYNAFGSNGRAGLYFPRTVINAAGTISQSATATNNCELPNSAVYDPANASTTASLPRCNAWSWAESIWGKVPSGQAKDTRDNVGVQYGLKALRDGSISAEEFVTLNEIVGGIDRDSTPRAARSTADDDALPIAYRAGIVASGKNLAKTAMIDMRGWDDSNIIVPPGITPGTNQIPIHHQWYSFAIRDRIVTEAGNAGNQALWRFARTGLTPPGTMAFDAFVAMDVWLNTLKADSSTASIEAKVRSTRPAIAADFCLLPSDTTQSVKVTSAATCDADPFLKPSLSPRQVAGGPRAEDVLKCQLRPLVRTDYAAGTFSDAQWARLQAIFTGGVCDWSKPGVGQQTAVSPLTFKAGPGGQPLPAAPVSTAR